jgi:IS30 family transposase
MNGLIRQFFPKKMAFREITTNDIEFAMQRLNHRPRKWANWRPGFPGRLLPQKNHSKTAVFNV